MDVGIRGVSVDIGPVRIVDGVTFDVRGGDIAGVIGPNGSGKSTLLRSLYRHLRPSQGEVLVGTEDVWRIRARDAARIVAAVPQERPTEFDFSAREVVSMGRIPHIAFFSAFSGENDAAVRRAIEAVGISDDLAARPFATLSGGERQRVLVARALVQDTPVLVLDEPTNHLDIRHQLELLELVKGLRLTTVLAIHDLNLAARYCDSLHVMLDGRLLASGRTEDVLTPELIASAFGVGCDLDRGADGRLRLHFRPLDDLGELNNSGPAGG